MKARRQSEPADEQGSPAVRKSAHPIDAKSKAASLNRLKRVEGQVRGVQKMIEEERDCALILDQLAAVCRALHTVGNELLRDHVRQRTKQALRTNVRDLDQIYDELVDLMNKNLC